MNIYEGKMINVGIMVKMSLIITVIYSMEMWSYRCLN